MNPKFNPFTSKQHQLKPSGFTLVELLAVIAIIAVLAAILIPVVGTVRSKVETAVCASNLRTLYGAYRIYANEHNDRIIPSDRYRNSQDLKNWPKDYNLNWIHVVCKYQYIGVPDRIADQKLDTYNNYVRLCFFYTVMGCPTVQNYRLSTEGKTDNNGHPIPCTETGWITYVANDPLTNLNRGHDNLMGRYFYQLENPAKTLFMGEKDLAPPKNTAYYVMNSAECKPIAIHGDLCNMLYADGHVEAIDPTDEKAVPTNQVSKEWKLAWLGAYEAE